jgi:hypothetical protein
MFINKGMINILNLDDDKFKSEMKKYILWDDIDYGFNFDTYLNVRFKNKLDLNIYTEYIKINSKKGEESELKASKFLKDKGKVILYMGGNGDLIDMKFKTDLIIESNGKILTVQVKSYSLDYIKFEDGVQNEYNNVDILIGVDIDGGITLRYNGEIKRY